MAKLDGNWHKLLKSLYKTELLILDDFGLHPLDPADRQLLLDLIEVRHQTNLHKLRSYLTKVRDLQLV